MTLDVLLAGRAEVERGWCKYLNERGGDVCAVGAVMRHARYLPGPALDALVDALPYTSHRQYDSHNLVTQFNDLAATTKADILDLYDRAIAAEAVKVSADQAHVFRVA